MEDAHIAAIASVFAELLDSVLLEPGLVSFGSVARELADVGSRARMGQPIGLTVVYDVDATIPDVGLARKILDIVSRAPGPTGCEDAVTGHTIAVLHANLARAFVYTLFKQYPQLMRGSEADGEQEPEA